jgi:hypothetical protein
MKLIKLQRVTATQLDHSVINAKNMEVIASVNRISSEDSAISVHLELMASPPTAAKLVTVTVSARRIMNAIL